MFKSGGCPKLGMPLTEEGLATRKIPKIDTKRARENKHWDIANNNLSVAQMLRDQVFWHTQQMDYRGRSATRHENSDRD